jgi:ATP-binding cassette subfamily B protein
MKLLKYWDGLWLRTGLCLSLDLLAHVLQVFVPILFGWFLDAISAPMAAIPLAIIATFAVLDFLEGVIPQIRHMLYSPVEHQLSVRPRMDVVQHLLRLPKSYYDDQKIGGLIRDFDRGSSAVGDITSFYLFRVAPTVFLALSVTGYMVFAFEWKYVATMGLATILYAGIIYYFVFRWMPVYEESLKRDSAVHATTVDSVSNHDVVRIFGTEAHEISKMRGSMDSRWETSFAYSKAWAISYSSQIAIIAIAMACVFYFAAGDVIAGVMTVGTVSALQSFVWRMMSSVGHLVHYLKDYGEMRMNLRSFLDIMSQEPMAEGSRTELPPETGIEFKGVTFSYGDNKILERFDLDIESGKTTALVGRSGSGKSTLAGMLLRFQDPDEGGVRIGGVDVRDFGLATLRSLVSMVPQDCALFNDTLFANIHYGDLQASADAVLKAAKDAGLGTLIEREGLDMNVGDDGSKLSGGERQRVGIARALLRGSPVLIFDEATSSLDTATESLIMDQIYGLRERTILIIAHRLSTVRFADRIVVMDQGRILESGSHDELMALNGIYAGMVRNANTL